MLSEKNGRKPATIRDGAKFQTDTRTSLNYSAASVERSRRRIASCIHSAVSIRPDGHSAIARRALAKRGADAICMRQPDEPDLPTQPQTTTRKGVDEMYQRCHCVRPESRQEAKLSPRDRAMRRVS